MCPRRAHPQRSTPLQHQRGAVLLIMLVILIAGASAMLLRSLNNSTMRLEREKITADALSQAKEALIGDTVSQSPLTTVGYLRLPDLGETTVGNPTEGVSPLNFIGNLADYSLIGKLPWKTLGITPLRDGQGECLWYVVSGRFKNDPKTSTPFNWDTLGQIDVIDDSGNNIASNVAALLVAPGHPVDGQGRSLANPVYTQCGGNYDARNYLDSYNIADAVAGEVNYFAGSTNSRIAANTNNKRFVLANNSHYNDQFLFVTTDDIFRPVIRRNDFATQIRDLLDDPDLRSQVEIGGAASVAVSGAGSKGADNIDCNAIANASNKTFCKNWKEMLLLTRLTPASNIIIDGLPQGSCSRVLIFGGKRNAAQVRLTALDKANPANYLEAPNLAAFAVPNTASNAFSGNATFNANNPGTDLLRCLP